MLRLNDGSKAPKVVEVFEAPEVSLQAEQQATEEAMVITKAVPEEIAATLNLADDAKEPDAPKEALAE